MPQQTPPPLGAEVPPELQPRAVPPPLGGEVGVAPPAGEVPAPMNFAIVNGQRVPVPVKAGGLGGFLEEATQSLNPIKINEAIQQAFWHPIETAKGIVPAQDVPRLEAAAAFKQGDYVTGTRKLINWLIPFLGPRIDEAGDYMQAGQYSRGIGATTDVGLAIAGPKLLGKAAAALPTTTAGAAETLEAAGANRMARVMAPQVGPQKIRFGTMAADVAADVARGTSARTVGGLLDEVGEKAAGATQRLDAAYAAVPAGRPLWTHPIAQGLERRIRELSVPGAAGSIEPATRAARLASLKQALKEVNALPQTATLTDLRNLRMAWDEGAQRVFTPITADDFLTARGTGHGWADARTILNEHLLQRHPELAPLNAEVTLWLKAQDVLQAAEEVERVRPRVGRSLLASGIAAGIGSQAGGAGAAALGAILGPAIERTLAAAAPTVKLTAARAMVSLADAIRARQMAPAGKALLQISTVFPAAQRAAWLAQAVRLLRDLQPVTIPAAPPAAAPASSTGGSAQ